jgi:hypothetical protein
MIIPASVRLRRAAELDLILIDVVAAAVEGSFDEQAARRMVSTEETRQLSLAEYDLWNRFQANDRVGAAKDARCSHRLLDFIVASNDATRHGRFRDLADYGGQAFRHAGARVVSEYKKRPPARRPFHHAMG